MSPLGRPRTASFSSVPTSISAMGQARGRWPPPFRCSRWRCRRNSQRGEGPRGLAGAPLARASSFQWLRRLFLSLVTASPLVAEGFEGRSCPRLRREKNTQFYLVLIADRTNRAAAEGSDRRILSHHIPPLSLSISLLSCQHIRWMGSAGDGGQASLSN